MANKVSIANLALNHIGASNIQSFNDNTKAAAKVNSIFETVVESVLRDHDWAFARKQATLAPTGSKIKGWDYAYAYPSDCIEARYIYDGSDRKNRDIEFEIGVKSDLSQKLILTNQDQAELVYTAKIDNTGLYDTLFVDALAFRLAADLALPIKGKLDLQQAYIQQYFAFISNAKSKSANEANEAPDDSSSFTDARK